MFGLKIGPNPVKIVIVKKYYIVLVNYLREILENFKLVSKLPHSTGKRKSIEYLCSKPMTCQSISDVTVQ